MLDKMKVRLRALFFRSRLEDDLDEEVRFHLERETDENLARGMGREEARLAALRSFGGVERVKEESRDERGIRLWDELCQDLRYGMRMLLKKPGFTVIVVVTLALGIGANSAIFSVINALLLNPFPLKNLGRLVLVRESFPHQGIKATAVSPADYLDWCDQNSVFAKIAAYRGKDVTITGTIGPESVRSSFVSGNFFSTVEMNAMKGRTILPEEDQPGQDLKVVIGHGLWQRRFAGDERVIGSSITVNGRDLTIVGVMPPNFDFPFATELWIPLALTPQERTNRETRNLQVVAELKPGITTAQAQSEMITIADQIERQYPNTNRGLRVRVLPLRDYQADFTRPLLSMMLGMAGVLLLIACANTANLLLARGANRQKEIAIRTALGAGRRRVIRQLMTEGIQLALVAGLLGLVLATWAASLIKNSLPPHIAKFITGWNQIEVDSRVLLFTLGVTILTTLIFSLMPAIQTSRPDLIDALKDANKSFRANLRGRRTRTFLVISETALALILLVGAGLMVKGFQRMVNVFRGAEPETILTLQTQLPESKYQDSVKIAEFYSTVMTRIAALPNVRDVAAASNTPLNNRPNPSAELSIEGRPAPLPGERRLSDLVVISPRYFTTINMPLRSGRDFSENDGLESPPVGIISRLAGERYWPGENPIGRRFKIDGLQSNSPWITIIGIADDIKQSYWDKEIRSQLYLPYRQAPRPLMTVMLKTSGDPMDLIAATRARIGEIDRDQPINEIMTLAQLFTDEMSPFSFTAFLLLIFGGIALVMSAAGVYGVMSFIAAQRTHEIGVRIALGARPKDILRLIMGWGIKTSSIGLLIGLPVALGLNRLMAKALFGIVSLEYSVLILFASILAGSILIAGYLPARRAAKIDPLSSLRHE